MSQPSAQPSPTPARKVRWTLRKRLLLVVLAINVGVVGAGAVLLGREAGRRAEEVAHDLLGESIYLLKGTIQPEGKLNVARILQWPSWPRFGDAVLLDRNWARGADGRIVPRGVLLNPLGSSERDPEFDEQAVYAAIARTVLEGAAIEDVAGGRAIPISYPAGAWGGFWYRLPEPESLWSLFRRYLALPLLLSTALLTGGTFLAMRRFVLDPVAELAAGARRMAAGDLAVRVPEPGREDELADLMRGFNAMSERVQGFNAHLAEEVAQATARARKLEAAAMMQRRLAATGELAAGIAHEINNPLGGLLNAVEVLERDELPPAKRRQYLELLRQGLERIRRTVGQLLRFTPRRTEMVAVELVDPVLDAIGLVRHRARELGVRMRLNGMDCETSEPEELRARGAVLPAALGEPNEFGQAILNLLVNALDALAEKPGARHVDVALDRDGDWLRVVVADDGPGVAESELARVADLFYTTKEVGRGSGLGLALVYNAVQTLGGTVELDSRPGAGFTATLRFPIVREPDASRGAEA